MALRLTEKSLSGHQISPGHLSRVLIGHLLEFGCGPRSLILRSAGRKSLERLSGTCRNARPQQIKARLADSGSTNYKSEGVDFQGRCPTTIELDLAPSDATLLFAALRLRALEIFLCRSFKIVLLMECDRAFTSSKGLTIADSIEWYQ